MKRQRSQTPAGGGADNLSGTGKPSRRERRLRRLSRLRVASPDATKEWQPDRLRRTVLEQFRAKGNAVGLSGAALENVMDRVLVTEVRRERFLVTPADDFVCVVGLGAIKTVAGQVVVDPVEGSEAVSRRRKAKRQWLTVQFAKPSHIVGLTPMARGRQTRKFAAMAHCDSAVAVMGRQLITELLAKTPALGRLLMMAYHSRALSRLIASKCRSLRLPTADCLKAEIVQLARHFPLDGHPGGVSLKLHHQDFAELIGVTRPTVARAMRQLKAQDVVRLDRALQRYVVHPAVVSATDFAPTGKVPDEGYPAGDAERERFKKSLRWAMRHVGLPQAVFDVLINGAELRAYAPEEVIGVNDRLYATVLIAGAARVLVEVAPRRDVGVWIAKPGHVIGSGWISRAGDHVPAFHAIAHDTGTSELCQVAILKEDVMLQAMNALRPAEILMFLEYCHQALSRQLYDRTVMLPLGNSERLLYQLHVLAGDFARPSPDGTVIDLPLNPGRDLAPLIATNARGIGRAKRDLEEAGRIRIQEDGRILVVGLHITQSVA